MSDVNESLVIPTHDAILPYMFEGVKWAIPNVGDNKETHNMAIARLFEKIGEHLQAFSVRTDCFVPGPPTLSAVKHHHNMFVRLCNLIDTNTKPDNMERLEAHHITHERRAFKIYPVRYFDVKNDYCRRWIELCLQGLSDMAQLSENTWANDWSLQTGKEMKKLFREAYRLMAVELFRIPVIEAHSVFNEEAPFYLAAEHFVNYDVSHIPTIEWIKHPALGSEFTEDELRPIATPNVPVAPGVPENEENTPQRELERRMQGGEVVP
jgi:hypothetical protein